MQVNVQEVTASSSYGDVENEVERLIERSVVSARLRPRIVIPVHNN